MNQPFKFDVDADHLPIVNRILDRSKMLLEFAQACRDCGYPVDSHIEEIQSHNDIATKTKSTFFPSSH